MIEPMATKEMVDMLYILPITEQDIYIIYPLFGVSLDPDTYEPPVTCLRCGQLLYVPFNKSDLGNVTITIPRGELYRPVARSHDIFIRSEKELPSIMFYDRKMTRYESRGSSVLQTNEKDYFEMYVDDIKDYAPEYICPLICPICNKDLGNHNDIAVSLAEVNICSETCANIWIEKNKDKGDSR